MKLIACFAFLFASVGAALAQDASYRQPVNQGQQKVQRHATIYSRNVSGVVPRAFQGNPLQMLNPRAPAKYGTAEESVMLEPYTGKWNGIKFFTIYFD